MKRSRLNRGTKPLKRKPLKRGRKRIKPRSQTNSRPWEHLPRRQAYAWENPDCELSRHLSGPDWEQIKAAWQFTAVGTCQHHIFHAHVRWDTWANLITVCQAAHAFCHKCPIEATLACLWVKLQKREFDLEELTQACGYNVLGWVENHHLTDDCDSWLWSYEEMRLDILESS